MKAFLTFCVLFFSVNVAFAQSVWQSNFDSRIEFYQNTDFGVLLVGTERSLYGVDANNGETIWRRSHGGLSENSISAIPDTDLILLSLDLGEKSVLVAVDLLSGETLWQSDKVKGDVQQLAVEPENDLLAVVLTKKSRGKVGEEMKRNPIIHLLNLADGKEYWKREFDSDVALMPTEFTENKTVSFTLDNYRPPLILDNRVYLFYDGVTSYDVRSGKEKQREKFKINEDGLALTEADAVFDDRFLYLSGRGKIRAVNRKNGDIEWEAKDLGITAEMFLIDNVIFVRTGGQFTRLKDGETEEKGSFGISAIDKNNGKTLWRWKGGDKGLTNFVFQTADKILVADKNELVQLDAKNGKRLNKIDHKIEKAQFVLLNERGEAVVGGKDTISAFNSSFQKTWTAKYKAPGRGLLRIISAIALRATALYFRYGSFATSAFGFAKNGLNLARTLSSLRFSGLKTRFSSLNLTSLAGNYARNFVSNRIKIFGVASRLRNIPSIPNLQIQRSTLIGRIAPSRNEVQEKLLDKLDPLRQAERLADYLLKRKQLAEIRGNFMYFYTDLGKRNGLVGINVHNGQPQRTIETNEPDLRFITDEINGLLFSANGNRLFAFSLD